MTLFAFGWLGTGCEKKKCPPGETEYSGHCFKLDGQNAAPADASSAGTGGSASDSIATSASGAMSMPSAAGAAAVSGGAADAGSAGTECVATSESCDGEDNDCDGLADEALVQPCGPPSRGQCRQGTETCVDGAWSACTGAVEASLEVCDAEFSDENCDGAANEGCACATGEQRPCAKAEGICEPGRQRCTDGTWGACEGAGEKTVELCDPAGRDEDCDGMMNEGCECTEGETDRCDTQRPGVCSAGIKMCAAGKWGRCVATAAAGVEVCDAQMLDEDCDGMANEDCCEDGATEECATDLEGACRAGSRRCSAGRWGACESEAAPADETCDGADNDCNGMVDDGDPCPEGQRCVRNGGNARCAGCTRATESTDCPNTDPCARNRCGDDGTCVAERRPDGMMCETNAGAGRCTAGTCATDDEVVCYVHGDDPNVRTPSMPGVRFEAGGLAWQACAADGCNAWFGMCETRAGRMAVEWEIFGDGRTNVLGSTRSIGHLAPDQAFAPEYPLELRRWFGNPRTRDGRAVECQLFGDDARPVGRRAREFRVAGPDRVCAADGTCARWFGLCRVAQSLER